jgi:excisionase family DNA binding protein
MDKRLLNAKAAAGYLSISRSNLYLLVQKEAIRSIKLGGRRLFDIRDLDAFVDHQKLKQINLNGQFKFKQSQ